MAVASECGDKQRALESVLASPALGRSEQLRQLLRFLVTEEIEGRGGELNEYAIGVKALGRPAEFAPELDSTVRTRTHELRKRIEEHYRTTASAGTRIEIPKGTYRPRFVQEMEEAAESPAGPAPAEPARAPSRFWHGAAAGAAAILAVALAVQFLWPAPEGERAAQRVWGPLLEKGSSVTLLLATAPQLWIRDFGSDPLPVGDPPFTLPAPEDPRLSEWYKQNLRFTPRQPVLHPNHHGVLGGEASAAVTLAGFLAARGVRVEQWHAEHPGAAEIKDRNAVVLGRAEYNRVAHSLQPPQGFSVRYVPERREMGIVSADGKQAYFREKSGTINYGLITVLTNRTNAGPRRTILFAGLNSDGSQGAMEYLTTLADLTELVREFKGEVPASFQVVVRTRSADTRALRGERAAVRVLE
jgi:hypothetical protein